jgi:hypothetical protein
MSPVSQEVGNVRDAPVPTDLQELDPQLDPVDEEEPTAPEAEGQPPSAAFHSAGKPLRSSGETLPPAVHPMGKAIEAFGEPSLEPRRPSTGRQARRRVSSEWARRRDTRKDVLWSLNDSSVLHGLPAPMRPRGIAPGGCSTPPPGSLASGFSAMIRVPTPARHPAIGQILRSVEARPPMAGSLD